ncbi:MAG: ubiquinone/menaquinone biosynthesis protein, partial [Mycobacterium sp.]
MLDELVGTGPVRVLDVGAGTGIASRQLIARGAELVALEPDPR